MSMNSLLNADQLVDELVSILPETLQATLIGLLACD